MRLQAASAHRWPLGALFVFIATALVAVFGITAANAAARHVAGSTATEAVPPASTTSGLAVVTSSVAAPERGDETAPAPPAASPPEPVRPAALLVPAAAPTEVADRAAAGFDRPERGRAPPA